MLLKTSLLLLSCTPLLFGLALESRSTDPAPAIEESEEHPLGWLAGHWVGKGLGGEVEEVWSSPRAGIMMGMFRAVKEERTSLFEFITVQLGRDGWEMRLRHFHSDLAAWEPKEEPLVWPLSHADKTSASFGPVTYELDGGNRLLVFVELEEGQEPTKLVFERVLTARAAKHPKAAEERAQKR